MAKAGRPPAIEGHPKRAEILKAVLEPGANYSEIQRKFNISEEALTTFRKKHVTPAMQEVVDTVAELQAANPIAARDVLAKLDLIVDRGYRMLAACDAWLEDPNAPGHYSLNPRTHEIDVVYERDIAGTNGTRTQRRTEKLSKLLADVEGKLGITVVRGETKTADPRKLILEAVATLKPVVELIGKATGQIRPDPGISLNLFLESKDWTRIEERLLESLRPYPPALEAAGRALATLGGSDDGR